MKEKVVVAMSGGVDSSVAAFLLKKEGYEVIGITLRLLPSSTNSRCCSIDDVSDARLVCEKIDIPFYVIDSSEKFKKTVFDPFVENYLKGSTPIPCLSCNQDVKFGDLFETAKKLGAKIASGHYAQIADYNGFKTIQKPIDLNKDQTYYLYGIKKEALENLLLPLGALHKTNIREIAKEIGLLVHDKKDSHEICFVPDGDHGKVIEKTLDQTFSGKILDESGKVLGKHKGIHNFTTGQRRGINVSSKSRLYVADINAQEQEIVLSERENLYSQSILAKDFNFLVPLEKWPKELMLKIRARSEEKLGFLEKIDKDELYFKFAQPTFGISLGQALVVYDKDVVLGGGIIRGRLDGLFPRIIN